MPRRTGSGIILPVRLTPKAREDQIAGVEEFDGAPVLKVRVRALPAEGRANAALTKLVARWLDVPPSTVTIAQGGKSRLKHVMVAGDAVALAEAIAARLAALAE